MPINIRKATLSDFDPVLKLKKQVHEFHHKNRQDFYKKSASPISQDEFQKIITSHDQEIYIVEYEKIICGYAFIKIVTFRNNPLIHDHSRFFIDDICIDRKFRKKGIGKALMQELELACRSKGIRYIDLNVWDFNRDAIDFYKKYGMQSIMMRMEKILE